MYDITVRNLRFSSAKCNRLIVCAEREAPVGAQFVQVINPCENIAYFVIVVIVTVVHLRAECVQQQLISGKEKAFRYALCPCECAIISLSVAL